ncbi:hypothetical protein F2P79_009277 [Pimephales promelas]|nr:hypothetical protein F2P79_009277 [Pimephales promelas]
MDQRKVDTISLASTIKELQRFLGFANFYHGFVQNYCLLSSPLTSLLKTWPKSLSCTPEATSAFATLKDAFISAPILTHLDPELLFTVERQGNPPLLHPCAFYSKKLSPAEQSNEIGDRELLAIKLALEEWRHWL